MTETNPVRFQNLVQQMKGITVAKAGQQEQRIEVDTGIAEISWRQFASQQGSPQQQQGLLITARITPQSGPSPSQNPYAWQVPVLCTNENDDMSNVLTALGQTLQGISQQVNQYQQQAAQQGAHFSSPSFPQASYFTS